MSKSVAKTIKPGKTPLSPAVRAWLAKLDQARKLVNRSIPVDSLELLRADRARNEPS